MLTPKGPHCMPGIFVHYTLERDLRACFISNQGNTHRFISQQVHKHCWALTRRMAEALGARSAGGHEPQ